MARSQKQHLAIDGRQERADLQTDSADGARPIGDRHPAADGIGLWNPIFSCNVYVLERRVVEDEKIWIETPNRWWQGKRSRIADRFRVFAETQKDPHGFGTQPISGLQRKRGRLSAADNTEFPDMIVEVVGYREP